MPQFLYIFLFNTEQILKPTNKKLVRADESSSVLELLLWINNK